MAQHSSKGARFQAITGNRLTDGDVVYFTVHGDWSMDFVDAAIADGTVAGESLFARALVSDIEVRIIEPYLFEVEDIGSDRFVPVSVRERIRTKGPTVRLDLGKQAVHLRGV